ncbi:MAG: hypothetical protein ACYC7A_03300 [Thermoanaerobaculia bacterium]
MRSAIPVALFALLLCGCGKSEDPVLAAVSSMEQAAEDRDAEDFAEWISRDYRDPSGLARDEAIQTIRRYLAAYEHIEVIMTGTEVKRFENAATVTFRADFVGQPRKIGGLDSFLPRNSSWDFEVRLVPEDGVWKAHWATWKRRG